MVDVTDVQMGTILYGVIWENQVVKLTFLRSGRHFGVSYHEFRITDPQSNDPLDDRQTVEPKNLFLTLGEAKLAAGERFWEEARTRAQQAAYFIAKYCELNDVSASSNGHYLRFYAFGYPVSAREAIATAAPHSPELNPI